MTTNPIKSATLLLPPRSGMSYAVLRPTLRQLLEPAQRQLNTLATGHPSGWITPQATGLGFAQSRRPAGVSMVPTAPLCAVAAAVAQL
ncbi:hypothetical protein [Cupriavidus basilensis]|uniref:Uncharacterized protein n=1 Tax=Cupriavidus basilensis TaxID=68895 RepID=A0A643FWF9_9BURK|nr:hypothetical protein [Cupriavidus basilensis]QOT82207.1 hypothetical protein F7R26_039540 [Cupriavidus basilensis]